MLQFSTKLILKKVNKTTSRNIKCSLTYYIFCIILTHGSDDTGNMDMRYQYWLDIANKKGDITKNVL